jgi:hypothetical protein
VLPSNCQPRQKLVAQTLTLSNSTQSPLLHPLGIQLDRPITELESLLHKSRQFPDSTALFAKDFLRVGCADDDFGAGRGDTDFAAAVALFGEFTGEELVELGEEDAVRDELPLALVQTDDRAKVLLPLAIPRGMGSGVKKKGTKVEGNESRYLSFL